MSTIFDSLKGFLAPFVGSTDVAGYILGAALTLVLFLILEFSLSGRSRSGGEGLTMILSMSVGIAISTLIGWFPPWVVVFVIVLGLIGWLFSTKGAPAT
jgi:putative effector of murein hydrolase